MSFSEVQGLWGANVTSGTTFHVTLAAPPTPGNAVICFVALETNTITIQTIQDSNLNNYTVTPNSPSNPNGGIANTNLAYLLNVPSNASATINVTASTTINVYGQVGCEEFSSSVPGTWTFDNDIAGGTVSGTAINSPSVTPAGAGELLFGFANTSKNIVSANSPWTLGAAGITDLSIAPEFILGGPAGATPINFTANLSTDSNNMAMALAFTPLSIVTGRPSLAPNDMGGQMIVAPKAVVAGF